MSSETEQRCLQRVQLFFFSCDQLFSGCRSTCVLGQPKKVGCVLFKISCWALKCLDHNSVKWVKVRTGFFSGSWFKYRTSMNVRIRLGQPVDLPFCFNGQHGEKCIALHKKSRALATFCLFQKEVMTLWSIHKGCFGYGSVFFIDPHQRSGLDDVILSFSPDLTDFYDVIQKQNDATQQMKRSKGKITSRWNTLLFCVIWRRSGLKMQKRNTTVVMIIIVARQLLDTDPTSNSNLIEHE